MGKWEVILKAGVEGGCITLYGKHDGKNWVFSKDVLDQTPEMFDEPAVYSFSKAVYSWDEALGILDKHPWHLFYPVVVHPLFQGAVLAAAVRRSKPEVMTDDHGFHYWL